MSAFKCPICGHGKFVTDRLTRYCAKAGCGYTDHDHSMACGGPPRCKRPTREHPWTTADQGLADYDAATERARLASHANAERVIDTGIGAFIEGIDRD